MAWYKKYKKISSALFNYENSGVKTNLMPPWRDIYDADLNMVDIQGSYGSDKIWRIVGYTENPPFPSNGYEAIAIMFEHQNTFEKTWWHFPKE
jgi:hypothetical protein